MQLLSVVRHNIDMPPVCWAKLVCLHLALKCVQGKHVSFNIEGYLESYMNQSVMQIKCVTCFCKFTNSLREVKFTIRWMWICYRFTGVSFVKSQFINISISLFMQQVWHEMSEEAWIIIHGFAKLYMFAAQLIKKDILTP